ncbi:pitrilysin family protein [Capnocytophaga sp.]|uniref:M16 family metallopeptidase n=1 Tax=Capnocytophaga sp. TaxID=44737 RepID=UPI0026DB1CF8|nr:pitrilysin family protein [Capnocytophaga sp.]MDO5105369.1 pitrilysin family protein [Capnocytophaga sp.]
MPRSGKMPVIDLKTPVQYKLSNGMTVLVVENQKFPRVSVSLYIDEPPFMETDKTGVSDLISALLGSGTATISKDDFNEEIDFLAARISFSIDGGFATCLSNYFPRVLELLADAVLHPNFTQNELDKEKAKLLQSIKSGENSAATISSRVRNTLIYGKKHPYGEYPTEHTINRITLTDVQSFYSRYFSPTNAYMVVSGDVQVDEVKLLINNYFSAWKPAPSFEKKWIEPDDVAFTQINFVDLPNASQAEIRVDNLIELTMANPDYFPMLVANYILGGGFGSYINMNLREKNGFTYGANSFFNPNKWTKGTFGISTKVRSSVVGEAITQILSEIHRIRTEAVSDAHIAQAKANYLGSFIRAAENPQTTARYAINIKTRNLPDDFYKTYIANINAVTKEDILRVAHKYFKINKLRFVVVGKGSEILPTLTALTFQGKNIPVVCFDKFANLI